MTHPLIYKTALSMAEEACALKFEERNISRRFRRIWSTKNKNNPMVKALRRYLGREKVGPEELYAYCNWTDYVEDARATLAKMLKLPNVSAGMKTEISEALIKDHNEQLVAPEHMTTNGPPPKLIRNPNHPGVIERLLFGDN